MSLPEKRLYEFGPFRLDAHQHVLLRDKEVVPLAPKALDLLVVLVEQSGHVLSKDELMKLVWPDSFVEEANLSHHVFTLRKALEDDKNGAKYIETIPRRGYRFVASVTTVGAEPDDLIVAEHTRTRVVIEQTEAPEPITSGSELEHARGAVALESEDDLVARIKRRLVFFALACAALVVSIYQGITYNSARKQAVASVKSIAVLPFKPLLADSRNESLELGMADTMINKLSGVRHLIVRPISAIRNYTSLAQDPLAAGRELGVDYVLEGNLQMVGEKTRATVRLLSVKDGSAIWTDKCDQACSSIFELQDAVAQQIASALVLQLTGDERRQLAKHATENAEAYQLYVQGRYFWNKTTAESLAKAIGYFERAIERDPQYALAQAGIADAYNMLGCWNFLPQAEAFQKAETAAVRALALDNSLAEAHASLGYAKFRHGWNWAAAEAAFKRAIELNANSAIAHHWYGEYLTVMQRFDQALLEQRRAQELDPLSLQLKFWSAARLYFMRQYDRAIVELKQLIEMDRSYVIAYGLLWASYRERGLATESVTARLEDLRLAGYSAQELAILRDAYAAAGIKGFWGKDNELMQTRAKQNYVSPIIIAMNYACLGEKDQAFIWLEKAYHERNSWLPELKADPVWDNLRSDPRYADLLRRVGFEP
jgi:DNA-binding winged helix-turn-helix (wHTH) protein/TolB-like protein